MTETKDAEKANDALAASMQKLGLEMRRFLASVPSLHAAMEESK